MSLICKLSEEVSRGLLWRAKGIPETKKKGGVGGEESLPSRRRERAESHRTVHVHAYVRRRAFLSLLLQNLLEKDSQAPWFRPPQFPFHPGLTRHPFTLSWVASEEALIGVCLGGEE